MKRTIVSAWTLAAMIALGGCQSDRNGDRPRMSQREMTNRSLLESYPDPVEASFMREYPTARVTSVDVFNDATGRAVYEINFVQDNRTSDVVYTAEGVRVAAPAERMTPPTARPGAAPGAPGTPPPAPPAPSEAPRTPQPR